MAERAGGERAGAAATGGPEAPGVAGATDSGDGYGPPSGRPVSGRGLAVALILAVVLVAVVGYLVLDVGGRRELPGTPLTIQTDPAPGAGSVCGGEVIPPSRLLVVGGALTLVASNGGADIAVAWPAGYAAREDQGRGGVYDPNGYLVAREGENLQDRFYGSAGADGVFHVCRVARD
jgi:hypothetical protein